MDPYWCECSHVHSVWWVLPQPLSKLFAGHSWLFILKSCRGQRSGTWAPLRDSEGHMGSEGPLDTLPSRDLGLLHIILIRETEWLIMELIFSDLKKTTLVHSYPCSCSHVAHEEQLQALHIFPAAPPPPHDGKVSVQWAIDSVCRGWSLLQQFHWDFEGGVCHQGIGEASQWGSGFVVMMHTLNNKAKAFLVHQIPSQLEFSKITLNVSTWIISMFVFHFTGRQITLLIDYCCFVDCSIYESSDDLIRPLLQCAFNNVGGLFWY